MQTKILGSVSSNIQISASFEQQSSIMLIVILFKLLDVHAVVVSNNLNNMTYGDMLDCFWGITVL
jgi:hypothetical protein